MYIVPESEVYESKFQDDQPDSPFQQEGSAYRNIITPFK
jgi:hypothetical protein